MQYKALFEKLGYCFTNKELLDQALRHRSMGKYSNERLEFLGDSILNFIIAAELFYRYPDIKEGELSRLRSNLVNEEVLADLANELQIGECIQFGSGELRSGVGAKRQSILADTVEAIIGAMYLDSSFSVTQNHVLNWFDKRLSETAGVAQKDPKTCLQEFLQMHKLPLPIYAVVSTSGAAHAKIFTVSCKITGVVDETVNGSGPNKRIAERDAAKNMLNKIREVSL